MTDDLRRIGGWLRGEARALAGWLSEPGLWLALGCGLLLWSLAYQTAPGQVLPIGGDLQSRMRHYDTPFLWGFHQPEPSDRGELEWWAQPVPPYRWASEEAEVLLPGMGEGRWAVSVVAASGRPGPVQSNWQIGADPPVSLTINPIRQVHTVIGSASNGDVRLVLRTPPFEAPGDPRELGLVVSEVRLRALDDGGLRMPAPRQLALLAIGLALCYGLARRLGLARGWALALALALAGVAAAMLIERRLALTSYTYALAALAGAWYLLAVLLAPLLAAGIRAMRLVVPGWEAGAALGATIGGFAVRMGGMLHPYARTSDLGLNVNNLRQVIRGDIFLIEGLPCEAGGGQAPYPPGQYLALAPIRLLLGDERYELDRLVRGGNALLESCSAALIWLLLRRCGAGQRAALLGAALYVMAPPMLRAFSIGEFANLFAQSLILPLLTFLVLGATRAQRWQIALPGGALLLIILLSHTGMTISVLTLLVAWSPIGLFIAIGLQPQAYQQGQNRADRFVRDTDATTRATRRLRRDRLLAAGGAALLLAAALFYSDYVGLIEERRVAAAKWAAAPLGERCPPGIPLTTKLISMVPGTFGPRGLLPPPLAAAGGIGVIWLWTRRNQQLALVLLSCWLGVLLSFGMLINSDQAVRWQHFLFPALCLGAGPTLASWMRRGRAGMLVALVTLGYLAWFGLYLWVRQIVIYLH